MFNKILDRCTEKGAEYADLYYLETKKDEISFVNNKLDSIGSKDIAGFSLQVKKDGKLGVASSSDFNKAEAVVQTSLESSKEGDQIKYDFNKPSSLPQINLSNDSIWDISYDELIKQGEKAIQVLTDYDPKITVNLGFQRFTEVKQYLNTYGCDYTSKQDGLLMNIQSMLIEEQNILEFQVSHFLPTLESSIEDFAKLEVEKLKIGRVEKSLTSGKMPVILHPQAVAQIAFAINVGLSGEYVLMGMSPLKDKLNQQIFAEEITMIDDMTMPGGVESALFDDEGTPAERTVLFENGVLRNYLLHLKSANALNLQPNGKASKKNFLQPKDYTTPVSPKMSNLLIQPGKVSYDTMISEIKEGIMIVSMAGLIMGNVFRGDLDSDIDMAFKIENGKIVGRVKDAAVGMNVYDIFKDNLVAVGDNLETINYFTGFVKSPYMLLKDINIVV